MFNVSFSTILVSGSNETLLLISCKSSSRSRISACYHRARFICEDSELLLKEVHEKKDEDENVSDDIESTSVGTTKAAETTTKSAVVNARQRNPNAEKDSLRQTKRRKVLVKKVKTESGKNRCRQRKGMKCIET